MTKSLLTLAFVAALTSGCAGNIRLVEDGKVHRGTYDQISKAIQVTIDGERYTGTYAIGRGTAVAFGATGGMAVGLSSDSSGQALLISETTGQVIRCAFGSVVDWRGQGRCQNNAGRVFDLLIGG